MANKTPEQIKKEQIAIEKKKNEKKYYDCTLECLVPATITWRVLASNENEALQIVNATTTSPTSVKYRLNLRRKIKFAIFDAGTTIIRLIKNF